MITQSQLARGAIAFSAAVVLIAGISVKLVLDQRDDASVPAAGMSMSGLSMQQLARATSAFDGSGAGAARSSSQAMQVGSVPSMIGGLETRLASNPDDVKGWALLAQSYAFTGRFEDAERALDKAVALGFDEAELRNRVDSARRDPHSGMAGIPSLSR